MMDTIVIKNFATKIIGATFIAMCLGILTAYAIEEIFSSILPIHSMKEFLKAVLGFSSIYLGLIILFEFVWPQTKSASKVNGTNHVEL